MADLDNMSDEELAKEFAKINEEMGIDTVRLDPDKSGEFKFTLTDKEQIKDDGKWYSYDHFRWN